MAKNLQNEQLEEMGKRRRQGRIMKRVFIGAAVCVAFFAIYALVLPASTLEHPDPACGLEEHVHAEECFETQLTCELPETGAHVHIQACYDANDPERLICEEPATGHLHTQKCFATGDELVCENTEADHEHGEDCYLEPGTLVCEEEETVHVHNDACYEVAENLTCTNEDPEHVHGPECTESITTLTCTEESAGHVHHALCYDADGNLTCTEEEAVNVDHEHNDACSEQVPACGIEEHQHDEVCYDPETLQMIQATKDNKDAQDAENAEGTEGEDANESEDPEEAEPVDEDELAQLKEQGLAWENENMILTFSLPEDTEGEVRFEVTEQPVDSSELSEEVKNDENAWQDALVVSATRNGEAVDEIRDLGATATFQVKAKAIDPIINSINYEEVADEIKQEIGAEVTITQTPNDIDSLPISERLNPEAVNYIVTDAEKSAYSVSLLEENVGTQVVITPLPNFTVRYLAYIDTIEMSDRKPEGESLHVIDTAKGMPTNDNVKDDSIASAYVPLEGKAETGYQIALAKSWVEIYTQKECNYVSSPNLTYFNKLYENGNYLLKDIQIKHANETDFTTYDDIANIHFTNRESVAQERQNYILIDEGTTINLRYEVSTGSHDVPAQFYDYDITDGYIYASQDDAINRRNGKPTSGQTSSETWVNTSAHGINDATNYSGSGAKYAFGNSNASTDFGAVKWNNVNINAANAATGTVFQKCAFGLVNGIDFDTDNVKFASGITGPKIFGEEKAKGKTVYDDFEINYSRTGDTYEIYQLKRDGGAVFKHNLNTFIHKTNIWKLTQDEGLYQYSNNFWAMDTVISFGTDGHDLRFGDRSKEGQRKTQANSTLPVVDQYLNTAGGVVDDPRVNVDHNSYFGMMSQVDFKLVEDYCGPLDYFFFGDDDMWVFLLKINDDGSVDKSFDPKLVCDIGGVHQTTGEYVNLWNHINKGSSGKWALRFYYTERGASGSTCYMRFTLPSVSVKTPEQDTGSITVEKKVEAAEGSDAFNKDFKFMITLKDADGNELPDDYSYEKTAASGEVTHGLVIHTGGTFKLKHGEKVVIKYVPIGTKYTITEVPINTEDQETEMTIENGGFQPSYEYMEGGAIINNSPGAKFEGTVMGNKSGMVNKVVYTNTLPYKLPETGGEGAEWFYLGGGLILAAGAVLANRRRHSISR